MQRQSSSFNFSENASGADAASRSNQDRDPDQAGGLTFCGQPRPPASDFIGSASHPGQRRCSSLVPGNAVLYCFRRNMSPKPRLPAPVMKGCSMPIQICCTCGTLVSRYFRAAVALPDLRG